MNEFSIATALVCPNCGTHLNNMGTVTPGHSPIIRKGQIKVCAHCCAPSIVGDSGLEPITEARFKTLDERTQNALRLTIQGVRAMMAEGKPQN